MGYAVKNDQTGWRAVNSQTDVDTATETYSDAEPVLNPPVTVAAIDSALQAHLDQAARRRGYADAATCVSYMSSTVAAWVADAKTMNQWRDDAWNYAISQEAVTPLPSVSAVLSGVDALASNPKW